VGRHHVRWKITKDISNGLRYWCCMAKYIKHLNSIKMKQITITQGELQEAMKKQVHRNKKKYYRKEKHKNSPS